MPGYPARCSLFIPPPGLSQGPGGSCGEDLLPHRWPQPPRPAAALPAARPQHPGGAVNRS
jgi:hypothetical protein